MKYPFAFSLQTQKRPRYGADTKTVDTGIYLKAIKKTRWLQCVVKCVV